MSKWPAHPDSSQAATDGLWRDHLVVVRAIRHPALLERTSFLRKCGGYTLIEILLVLAILVTMVSLVGPNLTRMFVDHQLKMAVERVRKNLAGTRLHALNDSQAYQFRFEINGQKYIVIPYELQEAMATQSTTSDPETQQGAYRFIGELPEDIRFQTSEEDENLVERLSADWVAGLASSDDLTDVSWSTPVLFFPDGTASEAEFQVVDSNSQLIRLAVRGLTGAVRVSRVEMEEED